jgi:hypothetical protein
MIYQQKPKKRFKKITTLSIIILVSLLVILFFMKEIVLDKAIAKVQSKLLDKYQLSLKIKDYRLQGINNIQMKNVLCLTAKADTLAYFKNIDFSVSIWSLLGGKIRLSSFESNGGLLHIENLRQLKKHKAEVNPNDSANRFGKISKYFGYLQEGFDNIPSNLVINNLNLIYKDSADDLSFLLPSLSIVDQKIQGSCQANVNSSQTIYKVNGMVDKHAKHTAIEVVADVATPLKINKIYNKLKSIFSFKSFTFRIDALENDDDLIVFNGGFSAKEVYLINPKISKDTIYIANGGVDYKTRITPEGFELDSNSKITLNTINSNIGLNYRFEDPKSVKVAIHTGSKVFRCFA